MISSQSTLKELSGSYFTTFSPPMSGADPDPDPDPDARTIPSSFRSLAETKTKVDEGAFQEQEYVGRERGERSCGHCGGTCCKELCGLGASAHI